MKFKNSIYSIILFCSANTLLASDVIQDQHLLDPNTRSEALKDAISIDFRKVSLSNKAGEGYLYDGSSKVYDFLNVNPVDELEVMIQNAPETKTEFYALDFGAGQFAWAKGTAEKLKDLLPAGKTLHIYSLTGENCGIETRQEGSIFLHNLGGIPLEYLNYKRVRKNLFAEIGGKNAKFDMIVTQFTLLHLVDPLGSFVTLMNFLPKGGMIMFDQFPIFSSDQGNEERLDLYQTFALNATKEPYVMGQRVSGMPRQYILKRTQESPVQLPFAYNTNSLDERWVRHAAPKPRAHYDFPKDKDQYLFGRTYDLTMTFFDKHRIVKGNSHALFDELYARNPMWKKAKTEWLSYWVGEKHPDDVREAQ